MDCAIALTSASEHVANLKNEICSLLCVNVDKLLIMCVYISAVPIFQRAANTT